MKKEIVLAIISALIMQPVCSANTVNKNKTPIRSRIISILSTNPFSEYYAPSHTDNIEKETMPEVKQIGAEEATGTTILELSESIKLRKQLEKHIKTRKRSKQISVTFPVKNTDSDTISSPQHQLVEIIENDSIDENIPTKTIQKNDCTYHNYVSGKVYNVSTIPGYLTDIALESGENIERITLGDNQRWNIETFKDISKSVWHIYLQPIQYRIATNMIISTDKRNYQLLLKAEDEYEPMIAFKYSTATSPIITVPKISIEDTDKLNFKYKISKNSINPQYVFDDGHNTYLAFDPETMASINPAIFTVDKHSGNVELIDYKKFNGNLIINAVYDNLQLRIRNQIVNITAV